MILNEDSMGLTLMGQRPILNTGPTRTYWLLATVNLYRPSAPSLVGTNASLDSEAELSSLESQVKIADMAATKEAKCKSDSVVNDLLQFLNASPTAFHAVGNSHFISFLASSLTHAKYSLLLFWPAEIILRGYLKYRYFRRTRLLNVLFFISVIEEQDPTDLNLQFISSLFAVVLILDLLTKFKGYVI